MKKTVSLFLLTLFSSTGLLLADDQDNNRNILKQGLLGAGVGAISAEASGGKAGKGALIGAGTNVIGGALLDTLFAGPSQPAQPQYAQAQYVEAAPAPQYYQQPQYQQGYVQQAPQGYYVQQAPVQQEDPNKKILKSGLLGAGVGAISASASGGKAGTGALVGAGTNVIGGALLDTLTGPSPSQQQPQTVYYQPAPVAPVQYQQQPQSYSSTQSQPHKKIVRKFNSDGKVISEEEIWE